MFLLHFSSLLFYIYISHFRFLHNTFITLRIGHHSSFHEVFLYLSRFQATAHHGHATPKIGWAFLTDGFRQGFPLFLFNINLRAAVKVLMVAFLINAHPTDLSHGYIPRHTQHIGPPLFLELSSTLPPQTKSYISRIRNLPSALFDVQSHARANKTK